MKCEHCRRVDAAREYEVVYEELTHTPCPQCGHAMELEVDVENFLSFIENNSFMAYQLLR